MGGMRRSELVIGCDALDLSARIASDWSEEVRFKYVLSLDLLRVAIYQMAECHGCGWAGGRDHGKNGSSSDAAIATMAWEYADYLLILPVDRTFGLVIDKGAL